jgi:hypothetical protein
MNMVERGGPIQGLGELGLVLTHVVRHLVTLSVTHPLTHLVTQSSYTLRLHIQEPCHRTMFSVRSMAGAHSMWCGPSAIDF